MDKMRQAHVDEINRIKRALEKTTSEYLKRDYTKALRRLTMELREYDSFKKESAYGRC